MPTILLIEDVPVVRTTLCKFLERGGHGVVACGGGHEALSKLARRSFDAVVTDIWMKDGDGLEFIRRLRSTGDQIPIIAITGGDPRSPQATSADSAAQAGANRVLLKPVTKAELLDTIAELVDLQNDAALRDP